jgi:hypothetical protein
MKMKLTDTHKDQIRSLVFETIMPALGEDIVINNEKYEAWKVMALDYLIALLNKERKFLSVD